MIEGIETFYKTIGESIEAEIKRPWSTAWIEVTFFSEHTHYEGDYVEADGKTQGSFAPNEIARRAFEDLRSLFKSAQVPVWCRARFDINSDGKFRMTWGYDDCNDNGSARFDETVELNRRRERRKRLLG